jgi:hypothetical protein
MEMLKRANPDPWNFVAGITVTDENCERIKLARSLYASGMKVASVSILCQDRTCLGQQWLWQAPRAHTWVLLVQDAETGWKENMDMIPEGSMVYAKWNDEINQIKVKARSRKRWVKTGEIYYCCYGYALWHRGLLPLELSVQSLLQEFVHLE